MNNERTDKQRRGERSTHLKLLGGCARVVLDGCLGSSIDGVVARKGSQQARDGGDNLAAILNVQRGLFDEEKGGFGIDGKHLVKVGLFKVDDGPLDDFADVVDGNVELAAQLALGRVKGLFNLRIGAHICLDNHMTFTGQQRDDRLGLVSVGVVDVGDGGPLLGQ